MAAMQKERVRPLTIAEQGELKRVTQASSERVDRMRRATALLAAAGGQSFSAAARAAGFRSAGAVTYLVRRFNREGVGALGIAAGRGRRPTYDAAARARIVATAQRAPDRKVDGTATWSLSTLERTVRREGLPRVGATTIRRVLHDAGGSYQRTRTWCPTGTAQRKRKAGVVRVVDPETEEKKGAIELAYRLAEAAGVPVWCQDEAGPYQAIPQAGAGWAPVGRPVRQPHEYIRGGTAKLLTLFRPATGEVRAKGVTNAPNAVLHPWLQAELSQVLATLPVPSYAEEERPPPARWATWLGHEPTEPLPPLRLLLVWDNLAGHLSWSIVRWLLHHGIMPLYTPLSGSWLNMAESVQRILVRRALEGHHPQSQDDLIAWLDDTVAGWNANPTPFVWHGKRHERRQRARQRRLGGSPATQASPQLFAA